MACTEVYRIGCTCYVDIVGRSIYIFEFAFQQIYFFLCFVLELVDLDSYFFFLFSRNISDCLLYTSDAADEL